MSDRQDSLEAAEKSIGTAFRLTPVPPTRRCSGLASLAAELHSFGGARKMVLAGPHVASCGHQQRLVCEQNSPAPINVWYRPGRRTLTGPRDRAKLRLCGRVSKTAPPNLPLQPISARDTVTAGGTICVARRAGNRMALGSLSGLRVKATGRCGSMRISHAGI